MDNLVDDQSLLNMAKVTRRNYVAAQKLWNRAETQYEKLIAELYDRGLMDEYRDWLRNND